MPTPHITRGIFVWITGLSTTPPRTIHMASMFGPYVMTKTYLSVPPFSGKQAKSQVMPQEMMEIFKRVQIGQVQDL